MRSIHSGVFRKRKRPWLNFHVTLRGLKANTTYFFSQVDVERLLNPPSSVLLASLAGLGSCTRPLLMPMDCL